MDDDYRLPEIGFIKLNMVLRHVPVSKSAWFAGIKKGVYPKQVKLSSRSSAWSVVAIRKLIDDLSQEEHADRDGE